MWMFFLSVVKKKRFKFTVCAMRTEMTEQTVNRERLDRMCNAHLVIYPKPEGAVDITEFLGSLKNRSCDLSIFFQHRPLFQSILEISFWFFVCGSRILDTAERLLEKSSVEVPFPLGKCIFCLPFFYVTFFPMFLLFCDNNNAHRSVYFSGYYNTQRNASRFSIKGKFASDFVRPVPFYQCNMYTGHWLIDCRNCFWIFFQR